MHRYRLLLTALLLSSVLAAPLLLLVPLPLKIVLDSVLGSEPVPGFVAWLLPDVLLRSSESLLLAAAALVVLTATIQYARGILEMLLENHTAQNLVLDARTELFAHLQRMSLIYHDRTGTADSLYRMHNDATAVEGVIVGGLVPLVTAAVTVVTMIIVCVRIDWRLTALAVAVAPCILLIARFFQHRLRARWSDMKAAESSVLAVMQEAMAALRVVKAHGAEDRERARLYDRGQISIRFRMRAVLTEGVFNLAVGTTVATGLAAMLYLGAKLVMSRHLSLGDLSVIMIYLAMLYQPIQTIGIKAGALQSAFASAERVRRVLQEPYEVPEPRNPVPLQVARGDIVFRHVGFAYQDRGPVLRDVSFHAAPGSIVGVEGATGSGKSTLVSLICRFFDPDEGQILLDGHDLRSFSLADLRNQIAIVLQDTVLFSASIRENIAYGRRGATLSEIVLAAKQANAHEFIEMLPEGYETQVGERGASLSGGQRQRIGLARAFLRGSPILILDEPTSALDERSESEVLDAIRKLVVGKTTFLISHRAAMRAICSRSLRLDAGCGGARLSPLEVQ